jgi:uncharacterized membrane protein YgdD (TMEM256/DUF423 family)
VSAGARGDGTRWIALGAALGALAVAAGALGAHALKARLEPPMLESWRTAALYHALHAIALVLVGLAAGRGIRAGAAGACFLAGVLGFSGSLYGWCLGGPRFLVHVTPVGGVLLIAGWVALAVSALRARAGR